MRKFVVLYRGIAKKTLTISTDRHSIPDDYVFIPAPNNEVFHSLFTDCFLVNAGDELLIYVSPKTLDALKQLIPILLNTE